MQQQLSSSVSLAFAVDSTFCSFRASFLRVTVLLGEVLQLEVIADDGALFEGAFQWATEVERRIEAKLAAVHQPVYRLKHWFRDFRNAPGEFGERAFQIHGRHAVDLIAPVLAYERASLVRQPTKAANTYILVGTDTNMFAEL